jgi:hypothetical protein
MAATGPLFQGVDKDSFAYKLLKKSGWEEGRGLVSCAVDCRRAGRHRL